MEMLLWEGLITEVAKMKDENSIKVISDNGVLAFMEQNNSLSQYELLEFHFHAPAEHSFNGKLYDVELHLVHQSRADPN